MTNSSKTRQHAEEMFKRIQKPPDAPPDRSDAEPEAKKQGTKTARLRELRLAKEATENPASDQDAGSDQETGPDQETGSDQDKSSQ
jgi:hypothetical protein